jgi:hypothetical protein
MSNMTGVLQEAGTAYQSVLLIVLVFYIFLLCVFMFLVPCCGVDNDFPIKTMLGSSLPQLVCRRFHVLLCCLCIVFCVVVLVLFVFVMCLVCPMLPVSLDYPFLIAPSSFSNVYLLKKIALHNLF